LGSNTTAIAGNGASPGGSSLPPLLIPAGTALVSVAGVGAVLVVFRRGLSARASKPRN
jgi:hypothetical protein